MLDTADLHLGGRVAFTFVEPYPATLLALLWPADLDRVTILESGVQDVGSAFRTFNDTFEIVLFNTTSSAFTATSLTGTCRCVFVTRAVASGCDGCAEPACLVRLNFVRSPHDQGIDHPGSTILHWT